MIMQEDRLVRINHTDPWVRSDGHRTSRTLGLQTHEVLWQRHPWPGL